MSTPRVLMVIQLFRPSFTGHGIQIERLAEELEHLGVNAEIATARHPAAPDHEAAPTVVNRFPMPVSRNPLRLWWGHRRLLDHVRNGGFDILHVHGAPASYPLLLNAGRGAGLRTVVTTTLLGSDDPLSLRGRGRLAALRYRAYRRADAYVAICPALVDTFHRAGIPGERVHMIPVGVSVDRFRPAADPEDEAARLGWPRDVPRALFVGAVLERKGLDLLLDAWERVLRELPDAHLYVAGPHDFDDAIQPGTQAFADACRDRAGRPPLAGRVHFLGEQEDTAALYRAAQVFVFPSRMEGFPNVLLEALASGLPAVATRIPGSTDVSVVDGTTGYVVEQEDAAGFAERTVRLLTDGDTRRRFSRAARAEAETRYAFPIVARSHRDLYASLLEESAG